MDRERAGPVRASVHHRPEPRPITGMEATLYGRRSAAPWRRVSYARLGSKEMARAAGVPGARDGPRAFAPGPAVADRATTGCGGYGRFGLGVLAEFAKRS